MFMKGGERNIMKNESEGEKRKNRKHRKEEESEKLKFGKSQKQNCFNQIVLEEFRMI